MRRQRVPEPANPQESGRDLSICSKVIAHGHCAARPVTVIWIGCVHEHVGPLAACAVHAAEILAHQGSLACGLCRAPVTVIKTEEAP